MAPASKPTPEELREARIKHYKIIDPKKARKRTRDLCALLGSGYRIVEIDHSDCVYRDLGGGLDVEICPRTNGKRVASVFIWEVGEGCWPYLVAQRHDVPWADLTGAMSELHAEAVRAVAERE